MKKRLVGITAILLLLLSVQTAFPWASWHNKGEFFAAPDWPVGLKELVSRDNQVGGFWMNSEYDSYHFVGDTNAANEFLERYARLEKVPLKLVLHGGLPAAQKLTGAPDSKERAAYNWALNIVNNDRLRDVVKNPETLPQTKYSVTINLWIGGPIDLQALKVPLNIEVESGGEIGRFVANHKVRQNKR